MSQPPDGRVSIDNRTSNQGAQGTMRDVTVNNYHAPAHPPDAPHIQMLAKVRTIWIGGVLEQSLYQKVQLQPGLRSDPHKVDLPIRALVQEAGGPAEDLPDGTPIASVFDRFGGALLILGAPGAGKTTLLLELCRTLLDRAEADSALPMPIVFPLSTGRPSASPWPRGWSISSSHSTRSGARPRRHGWPTTRCSPSSTGSTRWPNPTARPAWREQGCGTVSQGHCARRRKTGDAVFAVVVNNIDSSTRSAS